MTTDAKVGLLLGLVFIFIIAFVIKGLPNLHNGKDSNELTTTMVNSQNSTSGIGGGASKIEIIRPPLKFAETPMGQKNNSLLAEVERASEETGSRRGKTVDVSSAEEQRPRFKAPLATSRFVFDKPVEAEAKPAMPKFHEVMSGESLAEIAKKFYGDREGNKLKNVKRIFEANRRILKSEDEIYVGQKLVIPPLASQEERAARVVPVTAEVKSGGKGQLSTGTKKGGQERCHVVEEDESLWVIACEELGDGARYREIADLNADILEDEDAVFVGMRLKLPVR
jgi:nucleoid-associated protein YgaU